MNNLAEHLAMRLWVDHAYKLQASAARLERLAQHAKRRRELDRAEELMDTAADNRRAATRLLHQVLTHFDHEGTA